MAEKTPVAYRPGPAFAAELDAQDPLAGFRAQFHLPRGEDGTPCIYFCGNSLGLQPRSAREALDAEMAAWAQRGVTAHFSGEPPWLDYPSSLRESMAGIVGAQPGEVVLMNALTVNLHLMLVSFYRPSRARHKILVEAKAFPSDLYAVKSQLAWHGLSPQEALIEVAAPDGRAVVPEAAFEQVLAEQGDRIALVLLGGINYYSGQAFDLARLTAAAQAHGCRVGFDLAHAAGNIPLALHESGADFAVWCTYKYLNAGPGSPAACFVHEKHARSGALPRFAGWWGHDPHTRFAMRPDFSPAPGAAGWQISNPPILALAPLRAALAQFDAAGMAAVRAKSERLTGYLEWLIRRIPGSPVDIITPAEPAHRGAQLSLRVPGKGRAVFEHLTRANVVCDWREPDVIRVAPAPLYNTFGEVLAFARIFEDALAKAA